MDSITQDLRHALRQLRARPGYATVAVVTLALGLGATTTIFSVVDHLLLRELPFPEADRVVTVWQSNPRRGLAREDVAPANYIDWKERSVSFTALGAAEPYSFDLTGEGRPEVLRASLVTEGLFDALGIRPYLGRLFQPEDFRDSIAAVAVLGWGLWQRRFGGDRAILGRALVLDGTPVTVIGILPRELDLRLQADTRRFDLWVPRRFQGWERTSRSSAWWTVVGRLAPGVTLAQAQADLDRVSAQLASDFPSTNAAVGAVVEPIHEYLTGPARPALTVLLGAVALVLLIACVNVANLQLARGSDRGRELAVRAALGARRGRLARQLLVESFVIAVLGIAVGVALAFWAVELVKALAPGDIPRFAAVRVDMRVLAFAALLGAGTALGFGLVPALRLSRPDVREALAEARTTPGRARLRLRETLVMVEMAFALTLLVGAALLLRSFVTLLRVDPGFRPEGLAALQVFYYEQGHTPQNRIDFFAGTLRAIEALPGVEAAGAVSAAPFVEAYINIGSTFTVANEPVPTEGEEPRVTVTVATPGYFSALGIPVLRGRGFDERDRSNAPLVAVVNDALRRRYFADRNPIGLRLLVGTTRTPAEIVGVVGDVRPIRLDAEPEPELYRPHAQSGTGSMTFFVRTRSDPAAIIPSVQDVIWRAAPLQTFYQTGTALQLIGATLAPRRFSLVLLGVFAGIALLVAAVGIYGVINFAVSRRTHEVGVRMALGADRRAVIGMIVGRGLAVAAAGVGGGLVLSLAATPFLRQLLFAVSPWDALAFGTAALILLACAALASWMPARRAARIDPMVALRTE